MNKDLIRLGSRIKVLRLRASMSQEDLADSSGLHRTYIGGVERGERNLGVLNLLRIARSLSVTPGSLFEHTES